MKATVYTDVVLIRGSGTTFHKAVLQITKNNYTFYFFPEMKEGERLEQKEDNDAIVYGSSKEIPVSNVTEFHFVAFVPMFQMEGEPQLRTRITLERSCIKLMRQIIPSSR